MENLNKSLDKVIHLKIIPCALPNFYFYCIVVYWLFYLHLCWWVSSLCLRLDSSPSSGIDVDEFCPRMDEANMKILNQIGDHADDTGIYSSPKADADNESDSDNELLPRNVVIPEPDEIDAVEEDIDDLLIDPSTVLTQSAEYKRKHFSNTSSENSDSDDSITRGLDFKNIPVTATIEPPPTTSLLTNIQQTITRNLIANIMSPPAARSSQSQAYDSEDEISDFEILDKDDLLK